MKTQTAIRVLLSTCFMLMMLILFGQQSATNAITEDLTKDIEKAMKKNNVKGVSIIVVSSDSILWKSHFGICGSTESDMVNDNTQFALGSVTKVFTAASVMQLQDQGIINIDQSFATYLPQFAIQGDNSDKVTPRNIMTHHSGLPSDIFKGMFTEQPEDYKEVVNYINREYMAGVPNEIRAYSNPGYSLLGHMVAEVTGQEYPAYVQANILDKLGMNNTGFDQNTSRSLAFNSDGEVSNDGLLRDIPAGGLWSTATDMSKFMMAWLSRSGDLMSKESFEEMTREQHEESVLDIGGRYALGWNVSDLAFAGTIYQHTGTTQFFNASLAFAPGSNLGVVILTNSENGRRVYKFSNEILETFAKAKGQEKKERKVITELGNKKRIKVDKSELALQSGYYVTPGAYLKVYPKGRKLFVRIQGLRAELVTVGEHAYILKPILLGVIPIRLNSGRIEIEKVDGQMVMTQSELESSKELLAVKFEPMPITASWKNQLGNYEITQKLAGEMDFFGDFSLIETDGLLILSFKQLGNGQKIQMVIETINDTRAKIAGVGRYAGQSLQLENEQLHVFGLTLNKINE